MRLLIAEDELDLAEALTVFFQKNHFSVDAVNDGADAYEYASSGEYDAIILDVMMPKMNGIDVLRRLRAEGIKTPVMMLTAKGMKDDRITGFNAGADDYLPSALEFGDVTLDPSTGLLACSGRSVRLSGREYQVMELFMRSPNVVFSADKIMERVWGWDSDAEINVIWVHISNLRKKLRSIGSKITIRAVRGLGYALEESDD